MRITVCKDCRERHLGCHDNCERYLKERNAYEELKQAIRKEKWIGQTLAGKRFNNPFRWGN